MKKRIGSILTACVAVTAFVGCNSGTAGDPKTIVKGDLTPPYNLVSVTSNSGLALIWEIANTEKDIVGYNVYVVPKAISALSARTGTVASYSLESQGIPRCKDTAALFADFGFGANDELAQKDCSKAGLEDAKGDSGSTSLALAEEQTLPATKVVCYTKDSSGNYTSIGDETLSVSLAKAVDPTGAVLFPNGEETPRKELVGKRLKCRIPNKPDGTNAITLSDGSTGIANGTTYTAFVVAVQGEKRNQISWTSNFVEDIPTPYTEQSARVVDAQTYESFTIAPSTGVISQLTTTKTACPANQGAGTPNPCRLYRPNTLTSSANTIFISSDQQTDSERVFVSGEKDKVYLLKRNARNLVDGFSGIFTPGDKAVKKTAGQSLYQSGLVLAAYPGDLFDIAIVEGTQTYYGKLYFDSITTSTAATATTGLGTGNKTLTFNVTIQTVPDSVFYLTGNGFSLR